MLILEKKGKSKMLLNELFKQHAEFKKVASGATNHSYQFNATGRLIVVNFEKSGNQWYLVFADKTDSRHSVTSKTGKGGAIQIFSTVMAITEDFIREVNPNAIAFTADKGEPSRVKLYDRFAMMFKKKGWQVQTHDSFIEKEYKAINPKV
jgi:hypothetical protein